MRALTPALTTHATRPAAAPRALAGLPRQRRMTAAGACWLLLRYVVLTAWDEHRIRLARARDAKARRFVPIRAIRGAAAGGAR